MDDNFFMDEFTWSYSRLNSYYICPYSSKLQYVDCIKGENNFFGQYGSFCHKLFEDYLKGYISLFDMCEVYENKFNDVVKLKAPYNKFSNIRQSYYISGLDYFGNFEGWDDYKIISVEEKFKFEIDGKQFITIPDLIIRNKNDRLEIIDHKSEDLKYPKRQNTKVSEKFEEKIKQLYLNSYAVYQRYNEFPEYLNFNIFRVNNWIKEPFKVEDYNKTIQWAKNTIELYKKESEWKPKFDYYYCNNICNFRNICEKKGQK
jgi:hypothetical protein